MLRRWYSTVFWLRNSRAAMSRFLCALGDEPYDLEFLGREQVDCTRRLAAGNLATRSKRRSRALRPPQGAEELESVERRAQQLARGLVPLDSNQALAVAESGAGELERVAITLEQDECLVEVGCEGIVSRKQSGAARRRSSHRDSLDVSGPGLEGVEHLARVVRPASRAIGLDQRRLPWQPPGVLEPGLACMPPDRLERSDGLGGTREA